jgi:hypothetical protein
VLRWCLDWLERLEWGEQVIVNLRPETEDTTEYVRFDHARVRRILRRRPHAPSRRLISVRGIATAWPSRRSNPNVATRRRNSVRRYGKRLGSHTMMGIMPTTSAISGGRNLSDVSSTLDGITSVISP